VNRIVRLPALLLLLFIASSPLFSQDLDRRITIHLKQAPLEEFLNAVTREGRILFSYAPSVLPASFKVTVDARNKPVRTILDDVLKPASITWTLVENQVVLTTRHDEKPAGAAAAVPLKTRRITLAGTVREKVNGEVLIGAHVRIQETSFGAVTNAYGYYSLSIPEGDYRMAVSYLGFKGVLRDLALERDSTVDIEMEEESQEMKEVEIVSGENASITSSGSLSEVRFSSHELSEMPGFAGDIDVIKSLQAVPGINSFGDGSAFFYVRGGNSDQNLFMIDDAPIYNPSHLFGFFSALSPDAINEVKAYKGDFPAQYGGRLSSVIDIKGREGNMKRFGFSGNIGPYASFLSVEGPIVKEKSSFLVSGRISTLDWLPYVVTNLDPYKIRFYDINAKINLKVDQNNRIFLTFFTGNDNFSGFNTSAINTYGIRWNNMAGTARWNHLFNRKLFSNTTASFSRYEYDLFISQELNEFWQSSISNLSLKTDFTWFLNPNNTLKSGLEVSSHWSDPGNVNEGSVSSGIREVPTYQSMEYTFYLSNEQKIGNHLTFRYGLRLPVWQDIGSTTVYAFDVNYKVIDSTSVQKLSSYSAFISPEPRVSIRYSPVRDFSVTAAYSRNTQFMQVLSNSATPFTSLEVWVPSGPNIKPQKADQVSLGASASLFNGHLQLSADGFYKYYTDHLDYRDHANLLNNPYIEGELRFGTAESYGFEMLVRKPLGKLTGWVAYTFTRAFVKTRDLNAGKTYPATYDRPNDLCINLAWQPLKRLSLSATWILMSGGAITTPVGFYYNNGYSVPIYGDKNNDRLPTYHRLDLAVEYRLNRPERRYQHSLVLTVYNAYGRLNPYTVSFNKYKDDQGEFVVPANQSGSYTLIPTTIAVAGIIPSINYQFKF
jgi:outer membrane cobalamin receptor